MLYYLSRVKRDMDDLEQLLAKFSKECGKAHLPAELQSKLDDVRHDLRSLEFELSQPAP